LKDIKEQLNKKNIDADSEEEPEDDLLEITPINSNVRNILVIGLTGSGKSAVANTLSENEEFKSGDNSISITKSFQQSQPFT
jgi:predicted GTPase